MPRKEKTETVNKNAESSVNSNRLLQLTTEIVSSYVSHNQVPLTEVPAVIRSVHASLAELSGDAPSGAQRSLNPAVSIKKSVADDYVICLEDGKKLKMLKRYLRSHFKLRTVSRKMGPAPRLPHGRASVFAPTIGLSQKDWARSDAGWCTPRPAS